MKPTYYQGRIKMSARKNATSTNEISDEESSDYEVFITDEARQRFTDIISGIAMFSERGFIMDKNEENQGLLGDIVKEFYANLVDSNKKPEVMVRGIRVSYSEGTINVLFKLKNTKDHYPEIMNRADDDEFEIYMQSLCNLGIVWVETGG
ncbi:hypothetical protein RYX36_013848 [Vicia faba]